MEGITRGEHTDQEIWPANSFFHTSQNRPPSGQLWSSGIEFLSCAFFVFWGIISQQQVRSLLGSGN
jgi:hypothetical protein